jgi:hypothetical protein
MKIYLYIYFLILFNFLFSLEFQTGIGKCNLKFDKKNSKYEMELLELIQSNIELLVQNYGEVEISPFEVYITNNMNIFKKLTKGPVPEWGIGIAQQNPDRIVIQGTQLSNISYSRLNEVLKHEINHVFVQRSLNYHIMPKWFIEGFASYWAGELTITKKILISSALWEKKEFALEGLKSFNSFNRVHANLAYAQSASAINALIYFYGEEILKSIIQNDRGFDNFDLLFYEISHENLLELTYKYETYLKQNFKWMFLLKSSNILFISLPIILVIGYLIKRRKNKIILERWENEEKIEFGEGE